MTDADNSPQTPGEHTPGTRKSGAEPVLDERGNIRSTLLDFWSWAYSETLDNTLRGVLAEYLVGLAVNGFHTEIRAEWDAYDLATPEGIRVEVKSAAYLQAWQQEKFSDIRFRISEARGWTAATNEFSESSKRQADVYVFCVFTGWDRETADPLDTRQWTFYVAATHDLNQVSGNQKSITLNSLLRQVAPQEVAFSGLPTPCGQLEGTPWWDNRRRQLAGSYSAAAASVVPATRENGSCR